VAGASSRAASGNQLTDIFEIAFQNENSSNKLLILIKQFVNML
jgi:hypothetical protein